MTAKWSVFTTCYDNICPTDSPDISNIFDDSCSELDDGLDDIFLQVHQEILQEEDEEKKRKEQATVGPVVGVQRDHQPPIQGNDGGPTIERTDVDKGVVSFFASPSDGTVVPHVIVRKFPGPAGVLPPITREELRLINKKEALAKPLFEKVANYATSSQDLVALESSRKGKPGQQEMAPSRVPWKRLTQRLGLDAKDESDPLNSVNISWIRRMAPAFPPETRIPLLIAVVYGTLDLGPARKLRHKTPSVRLMDPTGSLVAAFSSGFLEAFGSNMVPGTAVAIQNVMHIKYFPIILFATLT